MSREHRAQSTKHDYRAHLVVDGQECVRQEGKGEEEEGAAPTREKTEEGESLVVLVVDGQKCVGQEGRGEEEEGAALTREKTEEGESLAVMVGEFEEGGRRRARCR